jgi:hypothetical protein
MSKARPESNCMIAPVCMVLVSVLAGCGKPSERAAGSKPKSQTQPQAQPQAQPQEQPQRPEPPRMKMTTDIPASITVPDKVETSIGTLNFFDGVPTKATVEATYDFLDKVHGYKVFLSMIPSMSIYQLREGQRSAGAKKSHQICIGRRSFSTS